MYSIYPAAGQPLPMQASPLALPLADCFVRAGFPSPAGDFQGKRLNISELLVQHPQATYFLRVAGLSMKEYGSRSSWPGPRGFGLPDAIALRFFDMSPRQRVMLARVGCGFALHRFWACSHIPGSSQLAIDIPVGRCHQIATKNMWTENIEPNTTYPQSVRR